MSHHHNCTCGCSHDDVQTITLTTDDDQTMICQVIGTFELDAKDYIVLLPEDGEDAFIYGYSEVDGEEIELRKIEADQEFDKVTKHFLEIYEA